MSDPSGGAMFVADPKKPGGCAWWVGRVDAGGCCASGQTTPLLPACLALSRSDPGLKSAVGGHVLAHASTVRLSVRKGKAEQRLMKVGGAHWERWAWGSRSGGPLPQRLQA